MLIQLSLRRRLVLVLGVALLLASLLTGIYTDDST
jgi:hypothetical protein